LLGNYEPALKYIWGNENLPYQTRMDVWELLQVCTWMRNMLDPPPKRDSEFRWKWTEQAKYRQRDVEKLEKEFNLPDWALELPAQRLGR
jgi:hypothetical protein